MLKDRLFSFMQDRSLNASKFAEMIGVQPSSISHILSGRNKPGYDLLLSILNRFPEIDPDWLLVGRGSMYRTPSSESMNPNGLSERSVPHSVSASNVIQPNQSELFQTATSDEVDTSPPDKSNSGPRTAGTEIPSVAGMNPASADKKAIDKIIILYTDGSFGVYANRT